MGRTIARHVLGAERLPIRDLARADDHAYRHALEIGTLGEEAPELSGWREVERREIGKFTLRRLENPSPVDVKFRFVDHVRPPELVVSEGGDQERELCPFNPERAEASRAGFTAPWRSPGNATRAAAAPPTSSA